MGGPITAFASGLLAQLGNDTTNGLVHESVQLAEGAPGFPLLPALVFTPLLGALLIGLIPGSRAELHRATAIITAVVTGVFSLYLLAIFDTADPGFQFVEATSWVSSLDIKFIVGVDGISLFMVVLTGILFPIALFAAKPEHNEKGYYLWLTVLMAGCMGVFVAMDLFLFFLAFELTLVPLYFLIGKWGHGRRVYAANKFFLYTMGGSALMLVAIVGLATMAGAGDDGGISFDLVKIANDGEISRDVARLLFVGFALAFAVKVPVFPLHTWLPDAHTEAPTAGSVDLAGVLLKLGTYGFIRYGLYLFPEASVWAAPVLLTLGAIGIIYGGVVAAMQKNLKRLVAYSSVAHMGFCVMGIFALNSHGIEGSVLQMINHGIITGALFILLGYLYKRRHTYEIAKLSGIQKVAPVFAGLFTLFMLASIGVPGLAGFVGEFLVLVGVFMAHRWWAVVAAAGVILAALYMLWAYQRVFHGEPDEENKGFGEIKLKEALPLAPLVALVVFLGVYPKPVIDRIQPSVASLIEHVEAQVPGFTEPTSQHGSELLGGDLDEGSGDGVSEDDVAGDDAEGAGAAGGPDDDEPQATLEGVTVTVTGGGS
ncbi:MAG: NADH-quinone oxidoreductase subunit M [Acidimicrobiia bacterium]|nr:NADH-quinone oxidoreductase subunit M [Acidimicrobiia bacterium]